MAIFIVNIVEAVLQALRLACGPEAAALRELRGLDRGVATDHISEVSISDCHDTNN